MKRALLVLAVLLAPRVAHATDVTIDPALGDFRYSKFCSTTNGSAVVTCPSALNFQPGDVGKVGWCANVAGNGQPLIAVTTIASRQSTTQVTMSAVANDTQNGSARCAFGTADATSAFTSAATTVNAGVDTTGAVTGPVAGTISVPCGVYKVSGRIYNKQTNATTAPTLVGAGACTNILIAPDFAAPGDGTAMLFQAQGGSIQVKNLNVTALGWSTTTNVNGQDLFRFVQASLVVVDNVHVADIGTTTAGGFVFAFRGVAHGYFANSIAQNGGALGACLFDDVGDFTAVNDVCSNQLPNVKIVDSLGRTPLTAGFTWIGGISDECGGAAVCTQIVNSTPSFIGTTFYTSANATAISVDGTSTLYCTDCNVGSYLYNAAGTGATVASGGKIVSRGSTWRSTAGGPKAVVNNGTFVDGGGNEFLSCTDSGGNHCTKKTAAQLMSGHQPVKQ